MTETFNQSLSHGLQILLLYDTATPVLTVAEISKRLGYGGSKTYRLVRPLIKFGFLQEVSGTGQYSLGVSALKIGLLAQKTLNMSAIALPLLKELSELTGETVTLTVMNEEKVIVLDQIESKESIRISLFHPGSVIPLHAGASSKAMMAYLPEGEWDRIIRKEGLKQHTQNTITDPQKLKDHLREVRRRGYAISDREIDQGVRGVGAPVLNGLGQPVAGVSVAGPVYRVSKEKISKMRRLVVKYAGKISARLGYEGEKTEPGGSVSLGLHRKNGSSAEKNLKRMGPD